MDVTIRDAQPEDLDTVFALMLEFMGAEDEAASRIAAGMDGRTRKVAFEVDARAELLREFDEDGSRFLVAEHDRALVGYVRGSVIDRDDAFFETVRIGLLHALAVSESYRGRGIASMFYDALEAWFREQDCVFVETDVLERNPALAVYLGWGFEPVNRTLAKRL